MTTARQSIKARECPACSGVLVKDYNENRIVCRRCGKVVEENRPDEEKEWRAYDSEEKENKRRVGPPGTNARHDKGLYTDISWKDRDAKGNKLSPNRRQVMRRLRRWDNRTKMNDSSQRSMSKAFTELNRMSSRLGLPRVVVESSAKIYREMREDIVKGRTIDGIVAAIIYFQCRKHNIPRTLDDIACEADVERSKLHSFYRDICRRTDSNITPAEPYTFVSRFSCELSLSEETKLIAISLCRIVSDDGMAIGMNPLSVVSGAIYLAGRLTGENITQVDISGAVGVSEVTVRNVYKDIAEHVGVYDEIDA